MTEVKLDNGIVLMDPAHKQKVSAYEPLRAEFDVSFKERFRDSGGRVHADGSVEK